MTYYFSCMDNILDSIEKLHRNKAKKVFRPISYRELLIVSVLSFLSAPFISSTFLLIPLIGQGLVFFFFAITFVYFYVRGSWIVFSSAFLAHMAFIIPTVVIIPSFRHQLDLAYFLLLATGIPVIILLGLFIASRLWMEIELREN